MDAKICSAFFHSSSSFKIYSLPSLSLPTLRKDQFREVHVKVELSAKGWEEGLVDPTSVMSGNNNYHQKTISVHFSSVQSLSCVQLFETPWIAAPQASLSANSRSSLRLTSIKSVMPSSHLILCRPLLLLPPIPPSIRAFSNESTLCMRWPKF